MLEPGPGFNVFAGDNGQGKTNLVESIYAVCTLRSFRTSRLAEMIALDKSETKISARVRTAELERVYELELRSRGRTARIDGKVPRPSSRYFGHFNVVLFAPEDLAVVRGSPGERRKFLDRAVFNWEPSYLGIAQAYEKTLRSRNQLLRDVQSDRTSWVKAEPLVDVYDQQLAAIGGQVVSLRAQFLAAQRPVYEDAFASIMKIEDRAGVVYESKPEVQEALAESADPDELAGVLHQLLQGRRTVDRARGMTTIGPHRDDLGFRLGAQEAASFASQGQTRALVLAWKVALLSILHARRGEAPVLLLDDVSSELDPKRNAYLFEFLSTLSAQCFVTTTDPGYVRISGSRLDYSVDKGVIKAAKSPL